MKKINFVNGTTIDGASTFNTIQDNIEEVFNGEEPMGSIIVDDVIGKNLFNKNDSIDGYYWTAGVLMKDSSMCCTNSFIKVEPNKTYTFSCGLNSTIFIEEYDANKTYIKLNSNWELKEYSITIPSGTEYVRLSFKKENKDTVQFEKGTKTEYTPYKKYGYNSQESMGKIVVDDISNKNLFNKYDVSPGYVKMEDGDIQLDYHNVHSGYIDISGCSSLICPQISSYIHGGAFYNENKVFISGFSGSQIGFGIQVPSGAKYIRINSQNSFLDTQQLERGTKATPYTPYKEYGEVDSGEITIIENLIKVRKINKLCMLTIYGEYTNELANGVSTTIATLPTGYRPYTDLGTPMVIRDANYTEVDKSVVLINPYGQIKIRQKSGSTITPTQLFATIMYFTNDLTDTSTASTMSLRPDTTEVEETE